AGLALAMLVAPVVYALMPPAKYTANARLLVSSVAPAIIFKTRETVSDYGSYQRTQLGLLRTRKVLGTALKDEGVAKLAVVSAHVDPVEWLEKELQIEFVNGSEILRIGMSGHRPEVPMRIVNAVVDSYLKEVVESETRYRRERFELLKSELNRYQETLRERRKELRRLSEIAGSDDRKVLAGIQSQEIERLGRAETELARVQSELRSLSVESKVFQEVLQRDLEDVDQIAVRTELENDPAYAELSQRVTYAKNAYEEATRLSRSPSDPSVTRRRRELDVVSLELDAYTKKIYPIAVRQAAIKKRGGLGQESETIDLRIKVLGGLEATLKEETERLEQRARSISKTVVDLSAIQQDIATAEEVARSIGAEVELLNVELQSPPRVQKIESAELPRTKDEGGPFRMAVLSGAGAFALGLVGISFWEFRSRKIDTPSEVTEGLGVRVLGLLPQRPNRRGLVRLSEARALRWQNLFIESVDAARTVVLHHARTEGLQVVMVGSAMVGEGKTSLASHLAFSLARAGRTTLLIDGDLRRPKAHILFDLPLSPGLSDVLRGDASVENVVVETPAAGVYLIPAGECDSSAIQSLASHDLRGMFDQLLTRFDLIVVDTSPVLPVPDALLIGQNVDAVLLSVMRSVSRFPKVQSACARMADLGIRVLGAVVTGVEGDTYGNAYLYQYTGVGRSGSRSEARESES
ncbi:MAG: GumC family protein, partial [Isosphaeraceae bacterium]